MNNILEIKSVCNTPEELLRSEDFSRFLKIFKSAHIKEINSEDNALESDKNIILDLCEKIEVNDVLNALTSESQNDLDLERSQSVVRLMEKAYSFYLNKGFCRFTKEQDDVLKGKAIKDIKSDLSKNSKKLSSVIIETIQLLHKKAGLDFKVEENSNSYPNVTACEIPGANCNIPEDYSILKESNLTVAAEIRTGVHYNTSVNKRAFPFFELDNNPLDISKFNPEEWVGVPLQVGKWMIIAYIKKIRGCVEMEPGLLNLFPFFKVDQNFSSRKPDGLFFFGYPADKENLGFYIDEKNDLLIGMVPNFPEYGYFGYCKKPILTLHNVLAIREGDFPLHCGCNRYEISFDEKTDSPYISNVFIKADDMGKAEFHSGLDNSAKLLFFGTEIGAFTCLDGLSEQAKLQMIGREIGYNAHMGTNARQVVPVADESEVLTGSEIDMLLYINNYDLKKQGDRMIDLSMPVKTAIEHFHDGRRCAAGSTQTGRGGTEISYWANPFPLLKDNDGKILHKNLYDKYTKTEERLINDLEELVSKQEIKIGVAYSQLMAGVYEGNSDTDITASGFNNREEVEHVGPERLAESLIETIKELAIEKRDRLGKKLESVNITVAMIGDSRTGKSETAEKMEGILNLAS